MRLALKILFGQTEDVVKLAARATRREPRRESAGSTRNGE
jgi:hypothetical protein